MEQVNNIWISSQSLDKQVKGHSCVGFKPCYYPNFDSLEHNFVHCKAYGYRKC